MTACAMPKYGMAHCERCRECRACRNEGGAFDPCYVCRECRESGAGARDAMRELIERICGGSVA